MVELVECYRAGMIVRDPAEKVSISTSSVKRILRRAGARKPPG
jgi:transposase-like protein